MSFNASVNYSVTDNGKKSGGIDLVSDISGQATLGQLLQFTKGALLSISSEVLREEQGNGFDQHPVVVIDGKFGRKEVDVNPLGKIEYVARQDIKEIILFSYDAIVSRSPNGGAKSTKDQTKFIDVNVVTFNGKEIARSKGELNAWLATSPVINNKDVVRFVNLSPYARKLERYGISNKSPAPPKKYKAPKEVKGGGFNKIAVRKPSGAYALAYRSISNKFKKNSIIKFDMVTGDKLGLIGPGRVFKNPGRGKGRPYLYPSIIIRVISSGITGGLQ